MPLRPLRVTSSRSETRFLQPLFNNWSKRKSHGIEVAGAPDWLLRIEVDNEKRPARTFDALGYSFEVDVLWRLPGECRLVELKDAWKYEPLALAEILHHAHLLRLLNEGMDQEAIRPTMLTRLNPWIRAAMKELLDHGLSSDVLEYLEFDHLQDDTGHYLWLDSPLSPWNPSDPAKLPPRLTESWKHWFYIPHTNSWIGTNSPTRARPLFMTSKYTMVAPIDGHPGEFLTWEGNPPQLGDDTGHDWQESFSRYCPE